jgi:uncharacterized protein (DUF305 family)
MALRFPSLRATGALAAVFAAGCAGSTHQPAAGQVRPTPVTAPNQPASTQTGLATGRLPYTPADVSFMSGMIRHHAQAVLIAGWAPTHGASASLRTLCERIVVGQRDEIARMQRWLKDRGQGVPEADTSQAHMMPGMDHAGMDQSMSMPGMLTAEQLVQLDRASGAEFDRLFLTFMIQHHQGALTMVDRLFGAEGAGQDETVFRMASDIYADQSTEIARMQKMLAVQPPEGRP